MVQLQKQFTTAEQAQRLIEAGLPKESADCYYTDKRATIWFRTEVDKIDWDAKVGDTPFYTPCWSTGRLIEIMHLTLIPKHRAMFWLNLSKYKINNWTGVMVEFFEQFIKNEFVDLSKLAAE